MNYLEHDEGIKKIANLLLEERLIPIFGAGFTKDSPSLLGCVPDGQKCTEMMKTLISKYVPEINEEELSGYDFSKTAKRFRKAVPEFIPEQEYINFFKNYFTGVKISNVKEKFLSLPWSHVFTINIDDGIDNTGLYNPILPYHNARKNLQEQKHPLFKLHGDASYEIRYEKENNIIFDSDQYTQSLNDKDNQTMRESFSMAYKEFNLLYIGCSLENEPDIKYIYNSVAKERYDTMIAILRDKKLSSFEEDDLEDYGITDVILVKDYDLFYNDLVNYVYEIQAQKKSMDFPFMNPGINVVADADLVYFSGYRIFDENKNEFKKSELIINRDYLQELDTLLKSNNIVFIEGRRFSGKSSLLCTYCEREKNRTVFFFPSTTLERQDVVFDIISNNQNSLLVFDSNSLSSECYYLLQDLVDELKKNDIKIIIAVNQSDNFLSENVESGYIKIRNVFSDAEIERLTPKTNLYALVERKSNNTNLDYLNRLKLEQGRQIGLDLQLPKKYTRNEQILLLILCVKDKVYSRDIYSLHIPQSEVFSFLDRVGILCEWVHTSRGETGIFSVHKIVHNSKNILLEEIRKISHEDVVSAIYQIVSVFKNGDNNQKRIYREVMQFDTLNALFGRKKGAGNLIFDVYKNLEVLLKDDLHFWLQRSKSIYRLVPNKYCKLRTSYSYAKKVYLDSENLTLTTKAALSVSLICSLLYKLEKSNTRKIELIEESINLGHEAIFSDYYKLEKRLSNDLNCESEHNNYADMIKKSCSLYITDINSNRSVNKKACAILKRLTESV